MDRLTATIMLANDPSLVLVFVPAAGTTTYTFVYCNKCATNCKNERVERNILRKWRGVAEMVKHVHVVDRRTLETITRQSYCDGCEDEMIWTD